MPTSTAIPVPSDDFVVRRFGDDTLFLAADGQNIHRLDEVGSFIWSRIDGRTRLTDIVHDICSVYEVDEEEAGRDLAELMAELLDKGLVTLAEEPVER